MATEVLRSQDRLATDRFLHRRRNFHYMPNLIVNKRPYHYNNGQKKTSVSPKPDNKRIDGRGSRKTSPSPSPPPHAAGPVTLLRRGESLDSLTKCDLNKNKEKGDDNVRSSKSPDCKPHDDDVSFVVDHKKSNNHKKSRSRGYRSCDDVYTCRTRRVPQIKLLPSSRDVYAGSAFCLSPSPRSLPLPSFFSIVKVENCDADSEEKMFEDSATSGLRRLLGLD